MKSGRLHLFLHYFWIVASILVIVAGLAVATARLLLPGIDQYRQEIENFASEHLEQPITIESIHADWKGWTPQLRLDRVRLLNKPRTRVITEFEQIWIDVRIFASLLQGRIVPDRLTLSGLQLTVQRARDGSITIEGLDDADVAAGDINRNVLVSWLLAQKDLGVESADIIWRDLARDARPLAFENVALRLRNQGDRHLLEGSTKLPKDMGGTFRFALDAQGDLLTTSWSGRLYLEGRDIVSNGWPVKKSLMGMDLRDGMFDFRIWSTWSRAMLDSIEGQVSGRAMSVATATRTLTLEHIRGNVSAQRFRRNGWYIDVNDLSIGTRKGTWPDTRLYLLAVRNAADQTFNIEGHASYLRIDDIKELVTDLPVIPPDVRALITELDPRGALRGLQFNYFPQGELDGELHVRTRIDDLVTRPYRGFPGIDGMDGVLRSDSDSGSFDIDGESMRISLPELLAEPIRIDALRGKLKWRNDSQGWTIETAGLDAANADIHATLTGRLILPADHTAPVVNLVTRFRDGNLRNLPRYLPESRMHPKVRNWLIAALPEGRIASGGMILHGALDRFPFDAGDGKFEVRLMVQDAVLDYNPKWPRIDRLAAEVLFEGRSLDIRGSAGRILDNEILRAHARIADLGVGKPEVTVTGRVRGPIGGGIRFVNQSPLRDTTGRRLRSLNLRGDSVIDIDLRIPLYKGGRTQVSGDIHFHDNVMNARMLGTRLDGLNGTVTFTNTGLHGERLAASLLGQPVSIDISTLTPDGGQPVTRVEVNGRADRHFLRSQFMPDTPAGHEGESILDYLDGQASWNARLEVPQDWHKPDIEATLTVTTDLRGIRIRLPEPLDKQPETAMPLTVTSRFTHAGPRLVSFTYAPIANGTFLIHRDGDRAVIRKGALRFGTERATLPEQDEIRISGELSQLSTSKWRRLLAGGPGADRDEMTRILPGRGRINIDVAHLEIMGQWFSRASLDIFREDREWLVHVDGDEVRGNIAIPAADSNAPLRMNFERLNLVRLAPDPDERMLSPDQIPALDIFCRAFTFDGLELGELAITTFPIEGGLNLASLRLESGAMQVRAQGTWLVENGRHVSRFDIDVESDEIGRMLTTLGYDLAAIKGGKARMAFQVEWPGAPTGFELERLNGRFRLSVRKGRILEIDPGAGRVFGLLSLQTLPRRLSLDFSDLFRRGLAFDRIEGDFTIDGGDAYTNNLHMISPSARIDIAGRTGLADQDYDQIVTVTPDLTTTLPMAGALLGGPAGLGIGTALMAAKKLFRPLSERIDEASQKQYTIRGSWANPDIERIGKETAAAPEEQT